MTNLSIFSFESLEIRVVLINDKPWFVARDVFNVLDISFRGTESLATVSDKMKMKFTGYGDTESVEIPIDTWLINEAGIYKITFRSNKPEAEKFTDWLATEVLPAIRKTGGYISSSATESQLMELMLKMSNQIARLEEKQQEKDEVISKLTDSISVKDEAILEYKEQEDNLNKVYKEYPGLKEAISFYIQNLNSGNEEGTSLSEYCAKNKINLNRGQAISVGQLVNGWTRLSSGEEILKVNGYSYYQQKHMKLLVIAIRYVQNLL